MNCKPAGQGFTQNFNFGGVYKSLGCGCGIFLGVCACENGPCCWQKSEMAPLCSFQ